MSDAINGGGGGGSDPMAMFQQILDPLGLFKGIGTGIDQLLKGGGAEKVKQYQAVAMNNVGQYAQQGAGAGAGSDPTQTKYEPPTEPQGYGQGEQLDQQAVDAAKAAAQAKQQHIQSSRKQDNSAMTAQNNQRASSQSAMTADSSNDGRVQDESRMIGNPYEKDSDTSKDPAAAKAEEIRHLQTVMAYFQQFDEQGLAPHDHKFDSGNLANIIGNPNASPQIKAAAQYLLTHPQILTELAAASGGGSGLTVDGAVSERLMRLQGTFTNPPTNPPVGQNGGAPNKLDTGGGGKPNVGGGKPTDQTNGGGSDSTPPLVKPPKPYPNPKNLDECLANIEAALEFRQKQLIDRAENGASPEELAMIQKDITTAQQKFQQMYQLIITLNKAYHDMSMASIRQIG